MMVIKAIKAPDAASLEWYVPEFNSWTGKL
jgi:hypothetical protein